MFMAVLRRGGWALLLALWLAPWGLAQSEQLQKARDLYEKQEYVAAQEALLAVDRDQLTDEEKTELDRLLMIVPDAIQGAERAAQDMTDADEAFESGRWDEAERLYLAVIESQYGLAALKQQARDQLVQIDAKRRLAEAAKPQGPVQEAPPETQAAPPEPPPAEQPAEAAPAQQAPPPPAPPVPGTLPRRQTLVEQMKFADELRWQRATARMQDLAAQAREAVARGEFDEARRLAEQALQIIEAARAYAEPASKYVAAKDTALRVKQEVADAYQQHAIARAEEERRQVALRVAQRRELQEEQKREKIAQLFQTADQLRKEQRFEESADVLRQILYIDPSNAKARAQLDVAEDFAAFAIQKDTKRNLDVQSRRAFMNANEALVPWDYDILFPENWLELTNRRASAALTGTGLPGEDMELNRTLSDVLPDSQFQDTPFESVIDFLADLKKVNIAVDWEDLEFNGVDRDKPVTLKLSNLSFRTVLNEVLTQVGGDVTLAFGVGDGLIRIATKQKLDLDKFVSVYDIRDLLVNVPRFTNAARLDPAQALNQLGQGGTGGGGGGGGGGGSQLFETDQDEDETGEGDTAGLVQEIMDIIRDTVEPDSWRETGAGDGSLRELNGQLIVYNTSDAQRQVADLLQQLRETRALQIAMEARFLQVTNNFLEELGVDLDFVFNSGNAGYDRVFNATGQPLVDPFTGAHTLMPRQFSRIGSTAATPGFGNPLPQAGVLQPYGQAGFVPSAGGGVPSSGYMTPMTAQQSSVNLTDPSALNTGVPGSWSQRAGLAPALNVAGSYLDNLQVDFLIRATQANSRSSIVQAPRLLMFNGQRANITVGRARQYVASVQPQLAEGVVGFTPQLSIANSGTTLDVEGTISADRKYVAVTIRTTQSKEPSFERFEVQRASGNSPGVFITLLDQEFATLNTTVSIPDGGTVLLGGLKQVGEIEVEAGVPVLSKIPVLKRAFTNSTMVKDTQTLLILLKAKIIIQKEAEEEAFPTLASSS